MDAYQEATMFNTPTRHQSNQELLTMLLGEEAAGNLASRPLSHLFALAPPALAASEALPSDPSTLRLEAAKELMCRALAESMQHADALDTPDRIRDLLRLRYTGLAHEVFVVLLLDAQHRLIDVVDLFRGTLTQTSVYPREIVRLALATHAAAVVFAHNHPSGSGEPSRADEALTHALKSALALVDVRVLDHFVVAGTARPVSLAEKGLI
jgi:DNA repair protein RadC